MRGARLGQRLFHAGSVRDIADKRQTADALRDGLRGFRIPVDHRNARAFRREALGRRRAKAGAAASDDRGLSLEVQCNSP